MLAPWLFTVLCRADTVFCSAVSSMYISALDTPALLTFFVTLPIAQSIRWHMYLMYACIMLMDSSVLPGCTSFMLSGNTIISHHSPP